MAQLRLLTITIRARDSEHSCAAQQSQFLTKLCVPQMTANRAARMWNGHGLGGQTDLLALGEDLQEALTAKVILESMCCFVLKARPHLCCSSPRAGTHITASNGSSTQPDLTSPAPSALSDKS